MLEGVAYGLRDSLELLRDLGARPEVGRVSGGGARSELWLRIVASVLGFRSSGPSRRKARRSAPRCSRASAPATSRTRTKPSRAACASRSPRRARLGLRRAVPALPLLYPALKRSPGTRHFVGSSLFPAAPAGPTVGDRPNHVAERKHRCAVRRDSPCSPRRLVCLQCHRGDRRCSHLDRDPRDLVGQVQRRVLRKVHAPLEADPLAAPRHDHALQAARVVRHHRQRDPRRRDQLRGGGSERPIRATSSERRCRAAKDPRRRRYVERPQGHR